MLERCFGGERVGAAGCVFIMFRVPREMGWTSWRLNCGGGGPGESKGLVSRISKIIYKAWTVP